MIDTSHLSALEVNLSNERNRLQAAKTDKEKQIRQVWVNQIQKEIAEEIKFLQINPVSLEISDDDLLNELAA
jgi:hypothetical protein